jgi:fatty-acyl-CoA synthase
VEHSQVGSWIERRAREAGARLAVADAERRLDYRALHERVLRCAALLEARGVRRGERVALLLGNRSAYLEVVFAAARLGAIAVPVNARLTPPEVRFVLEDSEPRLVIHEASLAGTLERASEGRFPGLACGGAADAYEAALAACAPREACERLSPEAPHLLLYTSGTTGAPKGALLPQRKTLYNSLNAEHFFALAPRDRTLVALPLFHSFGLLILALPTLFAGGTVVLAPRFDPLACWRAVAEERIGLLGGVPTMFRALLEELGREPARGLDRSSLRLLFSAGAALPVECIRGFESHGLRVQQGYGQTETSILSCLAAGDALRKAGSVGRPVRHAELRVLDPETLAGPPETWREVAAGEVGEIAVRGPITMLGYWRRPGETAETLRGGWLRTGDLARLDEEGFLWLAGRARDLYISGGENVYPAEV